MFTNILDLHPLASDANSKTPPAPSVTIKNTPDDAVCVTCHTGFNHWVKIRSWEAAGNEKGSEKRIGLKHICDSLCAIRRYSRELLFSTTALAKHANGLAQGLANWFASQIWPTTAVCVNKILLEQSNAHWFMYIVYGCFSTTVAQWNTATETT